MCFFNRSILEKCITCYDRKSGSPSIFECCEMNFCCFGEDKFERKANAVKRSERSRREARKRESIRRYWID